MTAIRMRTSIAADRDPSQQTTLDDDDDDIVVVFGLWW